MDIMELYLLMGLLDLAKPIQCLEKVFANKRKKESSQGQFIKYFKKSNKKMTHKNNL